MWPPYLTHGQEALVLEDKGARRRVLGNSENHSVGCWEEVNETRKHKLVKYKWGSRRGFRPQERQENVRLRDRSIWDPQ